MTQQQKEIIQVLKINNKLFMEELTTQFRKIVRQELEYYMSNKSTRPVVEQKAKPQNPSASIQKLKEINDARTTPSFEDDDEYYNLDETAFEPTRLTESSSNNVLFNAPDEMYEDANGRFVRKSDLMSNPDVLRAQQKMLANLNNLID